MRQSPASRPIAAGPESPKRVLILGASGFLGRHIAAQLMAAGHHLVLASRTPDRLRQAYPDAEIIACDLVRDRCEDWVPRLIDIDVVINAAGIFRSTKGNDLTAVHSLGPRQLFEACAATAIARVIQISALGADEYGLSAFQHTKRHADDFLAGLADQRGETAWIILRPSLVIGRGGGSTALFSALAALPLPLRIVDGKGIVRPLHVADFTQAVLACVTAKTPIPRRLDLVGPDVLTTDDLVRALRHWLGFRPVPFLTLPPALWRCAGWLGEYWPGSLLSRASLAMLRRGHPAGPEPAETALSWRARNLTRALAAEPAAAADRIATRLAPLKPALRVGLGTIWLASGLASLFGAPIQQSADLVRHLGVGGWLHDQAAPAIVYAGAALDLTLGIALFAGLCRRKLGGAQIGVMLVYTALATIAAPGLWLNPFGPLTKNIAVFFAVLVSMILEDEQ